MPNESQRITELERQLQKATSDLANLAAAFYKNNFTSSQVFNKDMVFTSRLKVPHYDSPPTISEVGDLIEMGGTLYICTAAGGTFTVVGTQT